MRPTRTSKTAVASNNCFAKILHQNLKGTRCHFEFRPRRTSFDVLNAAVDSAINRAELTLDPYYDRATLLGIEHSVRSREFRRMRGSLIVSLHTEDRYTPIISHATQFGFFCEIVESLEDPKPADQERLKRYIRETSKDAPQFPIFFKMIGTVSEKILNS